MIIDELHTIIVCDYCKSRKDWTTGVPDHWYWINLGEKGLTIDWHFDSGECLLRWTTNKFKE